jgi:uncharacterized membrane protein YkoI
MRKLMICSGGIALAAAVIVAAAAVTARAAADEPKKLAPADVPQKVMDAVKARLPGVQVTSVEKETEDGNVVYDLELKHEGRKYEMDVKEDGTIMEIEKEVKAKDVPAAVTKAVTAKYPKATVKEVMEVNLVKGKQETPDHYEVTLATADGKESEVTVSLDGKTVKEEAAEEKAKDAEKDKAKGTEKK